jgi:hypothetical protein
MKPAKTIFIVICVFLFHTLAYSATITVCENGCDYNTIQNAVNHALSGDDIVVYSGTYYENIYISLKAITLKSLNGPLSTIIHGNNSGPVVSFAGDYYSPTLYNRSSIEGFTITGGTGTVLSGKYYPPFPSSSKGGGGIYIYAPAPTIKNCIITNNSLTSNLLNLGSAIFIYNGTSIEYGDNTTISNCIISDNVAGGIPSGSSTIYSQYGSPLITNCTIVNNSPIGIQAFDSSSSPVIKNTILWNNGDDLNGIPSSMISYSNIQDGDFKGSNGNISQDPVFVGAGNYHPQSNSPCIDSGTSTGAPSADIERTPRPQGDGYDMGAYEYAVSTLIKLSSFAATPKTGKVILQWNTESETDNAGFNLYSSEKENGEYTKINTSLIPAQGSSTQGASYEYVDNGLQNRKTYYYKLEDIDLNGQSTMHGPVSATPRLIFGFRD